MDEMWWILILAGVGLMVWTLRKGFQPIVEKSTEINLSHDDDSWRVRGRELGLDAAEIRLIESLLAQDDSLDGERLLNSRIAFEAALERTLQGGSELFQKLEMRRALDRLRLRRGWEVTGAVSHRGIGPTEEDELLIEGAGGGCLRAILIHRDEQSLALRVLGGLGLQGGALDWDPGTEVAVSCVQPEGGCLTFDSRVQEIRDLGDHFLFIENPAKIRIEQRREFLRTPLEGRFRFLRLASQSSVSDLRDHEGIHVGGVLDVGTGGAAIVTEIRLWHEDLLILRGFPGLEDEDLTARVVDIADPGDEESPVYGLRFIGLAASARDTLAKYVFSRRANEIPATSECALPQPEMGADSTSA